MLIVEVVARAFRERRARVLIHTVIHLRSDTENRAER